MRILAEKVLEETTPQAVVLNDITHDRIILLEGVSMEIWEICKMQRDIDIKSISNILSKNYPKVPVKTIQSDILDFINNLRGVGLIEE